MAPKVFHKDKHSAASSSFCLPVRIMAGDNFGAMTVLSLLLRWIYTESELEEAVSACSDGLPTKDAAQSIPRAP